MSALQPVIIPRQQHPISRRNLSPNALRVLYRLKDHGFIAYLVGGCVRDLWLGREPKDFDIVTDATPGQLKRLFRNCRLIGRRFRLAHLHFTDEIIEVATFRSLATAEEDSRPTEESGDTRPPRLLKDEDGMVLRDNVFGTPEEDALRRDFTVNALYYDLVDFSLVDYVGGISDMERGIIRTIGAPSVRFTEDPVRMLRAVRFAALLGFAIDGATWQAMVELGTTINRAAPARLFEEVLKLFLSGEAEKCYQLMRQTGLFAALFPRFDDWLTQETDGFPHTRVSQALDRVDGACQRGEKMAPQVLLALVFGHYLEEMAEGFRRNGASQQQALDMAVTTFLTELAPTVLIPHKIGIMLRDILAAQDRFRKMPGKRPQVFIAKPSFPAALDYLRFTAAINEADEGVVAWWENFAAGELPPAAAAVREERPDSAPSNGDKRPRRRRRRRRSASRDGRQTATSDKQTPPE
ncbi:MAG TPA: polynucleotide adenylyltransferase PcnB [Geobacteraceae bacterium]